MKQLIINADDFGLTKGVCDAIIKSHQQGSLCSTTLMVNVKYTDYAIKLAKENPNLGVGLHMNVTVGKPLTTNTSFLDTQTGNFKKQSMYPNGYVDASIDDIREEWEAQIQRFIKLMGKKPTHLDSHHHVHMLEKYLPLALELSLKYDIPMRLENDYEGYLYPVAYTDKRKFPFDFSQVDTKPLVEWMVHPGFVDDYLASISTFVQRRKDEFDYITSDEFKSDLSKNDITLINFTALSKIK